MSRIYRETPGEDMDMVLLHDILYLEEGMNPSGR